VSDKSHQNSPASSGPEIRPSGPEPGRATRSSVAENADVARVVIGNEANHHVSLDVVGRESPAATNPYVANLLSVRVLIDEGVPVVEGHGLERPGQPARHREAMLPITRG
jgi:hypothetical protein